MVDNDAFFSKKFRTRKPDSIQSKLTATQPSFTTTPLTNPSYPKFITPNSRPTHSKPTVLTDRKRSTPSRLKKHRSLPRQNGGICRLRNTNEHPSKTPHGSLRKGQILKLLKVWSLSMRFYATKSKIKNDSELTLLCYSAKHPTQAPNPTNRPNNCFTPHPPQQRHQTKIPVEFALFVQIRVENDRGQA